MTGDLVQIGVVAKNEMIKCVRGKKFLISFAIIILVFLLITGLQFMTKGWNNLDTVGELVEVYLDSLPIVAVLIVALLSSVALVSEFEERTALILFTRPVRRTSILIGKIISCTIIEGLIILVYYILVSIVGIVKVGSLPPEIVISFLFAVLYAFAASGVAFIISAFLKKGSVSTVISILLLVVIFPIVSAMMTTDGGENWYMIDQAGNTVYTCVPEYVDNYNKAMDDIDKVITNVVDILKGFTDDGMKGGIAWLSNSIFSPEFFDLGQRDQERIITAVMTLDTDAFEKYAEYFNPGYLAIGDASTQVSVMKMFLFLTLGVDGNLDAVITVLEMMTKMSIFQPLEHPDLLKEAIVLLVWGVVCYFIAWARFVRREF